MTLPRMADTVFRKCQWSLLPPQINCLYNSDPAVLLCLAAHFSSLVPYTTGTVECILSNRMVAISSPLLMEELHFQWNWVLFSIYIFHYNSLFEVIVYIVLSREIILSGYSVGHNKIVHNAQLQKLFNLGACGRPLEWVESYLARRQQCSGWKGPNSVWTTVDLGWLWPELTL